MYSHYWVTFFVVKLKITYGAFKYYIIILGGEGCTKIIKTDYRGS